MIVQVLAYLCFILGLMIGFPYAIVYALFHDDEDMADDDGQLFRNFIVNRLRVAACFLVAGGVFALIHMSTGG